MTDQPTPRLLDTPGERLRAAREGAGFTQQSLAERLWGNKNRASNIAAWEKNTYLLNTTSARRLADVLGVAPEYLLYGAVPADPCAPYAEIVTAARQVIAAYERNPSSIPNELADEIETLQARLDAFDADRQDSEREEPTP